MKVELFDIDEKRLDAVKQAVAARIEEWRAKNDSVPKGSAAPEHLILNYLIRLHGLDQDVINAMASVCVQMSHEVPADVEKETAATLKKADDEYYQRYGF
jgi:hypothetical protein